MSETPPQTPPSARISGQGGNPCIFFWPNKTIDAIIALSSAPSIRRGGLLKTKVHPSVCAALLSVQAGRASGHVFAWLSHATRKRRKLPSVECPLPPKPSSAVQCPPPILQVHEFQGRGETLAFFFWPNTTIDAIIALSSAERASAERASAERAQR